MTFVRSKFEDQALERIRSTCRAYGFWDGAWTSRLQCVCGDLGKPQFGLSESLWEDLTNRLDAVIHNGALVHWVYPYSTLKPANVLGTIDALKLCGSGKAKQFCFVSSTSALNTEHYVQESENALAAGKAGISEEDDLEGSAVGLGTGYGQSKWADEYLVREVGRGGLKGTIVRPGYVLGDSTTGSTYLTIHLPKTHILTKQPPTPTTSSSACSRAAPNSTPAPTSTTPSTCSPSTTSPASPSPPPSNPRALPSASPKSPATRVYSSTSSSARCSCTGYSVPQVDYMPWSLALEGYVNDGQHDDPGSQHAL